jgi:hypothetical protein
LAKTDKERQDVAVRRRELRHGKLIRGLITAFNKSSWGSGTATEQQKLQAHRIASMARAKGMDVSFGQDPLGRQIGVGAGSSPIIVKPWMVGKPTEVPQFKVQKHGKGLKTTFLDPLKGVQAIPQSEKLSMTALPQETRQAAAQTATNLRTQRLKDARFYATKGKLEI